MDGCGEEEEEEEAMKKRTLLIDSSILIRNSFRAPDRTADG